jgi:endonuclease-8
MPEGDTLHRTAAGLRPYLVGRQIATARVGGPGALPRIATVVGRRIDAVESIGKNLVIRIDGGLELRTHLGMRGSWHRYRPGEPWRRAPSRARLILEVRGSVVICFDAPTVELFEERVAHLHPTLAALGPDLLGPDFDPTEARSRLRDPARADLTIAEALLDQRALAGIGNVYKNEILHIERVWPFARVGDLDDGTLDRLVATAHRLLLDNVRPGSGPRRVTTRGDARAAGPLHVYGRAGRPCRRCASRIVVRGHGTDLPRLTYWCPSCQGGSPR